MLYTIVYHKFTMVHTIDIRVGRAVKQRRQELGLTLRGLAARSNVSPSMISAIERGRKSPTVSILSMLARAMTLPVSALFGAGDNAPRMYVTRGGNPEATSTKGKAPCRVTLSAAIPGSTLEFVQYTVPAGALAGPFAGHGRGVIEHVHLAKGSLRVVCGDDEVLLEAGDSCSCYTDVPHAFDNRQSKAAALLYVVAEPPIAGSRR